MKTESKILAAACAGLYFFLSAFYFKVDEGLKEVSQINTTLAVAVSELKGLDNRVGNVETDVKKLNNGFVNLTTRVGYLERQK